MARKKKVTIDRLDLKARRAELRQEAAPQQVHIRVDKNTLKNMDVEEEPAPRVEAVREEASDEEWREFAPRVEEAGPGEITTPSFADVMEEKLAKIKKSVSNIKLSKKTEAAPLKRAVPIRSAAPVVEAEVEEEEVAPATDTVDLKHRVAPSTKKVAPVIRTSVATKSFEEKIAEKTAQREKMEEEIMASPIPEVEEDVVPETFAAAPLSSSYNRSVLGNGLRLITAPIPGTKTVTVLIMYGTGSKYESLSMSGLSHFLEHMFFKGTKKRPNAQKLSSELDALGCEYNAFTSKEYSGYWIKVDGSRISLAMDILSDMLLHSEFATSEITKERGVIVEEINMYHENPMMYIEDVLESCLYGDTPAGREIAGPKSNIAAFKRQNFINYFESQYGSNSAVLCLAGQVDEKTERLAARYFGKMPRSQFKDKIRISDSQRAPAVKIHYKDGNQAIISLAVRAFDTYHSDKLILKVMSVILGGSMSSRMFTEVREKRGLAYAVHTSAECYTDSGYLTTQAGIPVGKEEQAIKVILGEYKKIRTKLVGKEELKRAKDLIKGRTVIGFEQSDNVANWYAQRAVLKEPILTPEEFFVKLDKVKAEDILRVAKDIFRNERLNLAAIGPFQQEEDFAKIVKL